MNIDGRHIAEAMEMIKHGARSNGKAGKIASGKNKLRADSWQVAAVGLVVWVVAGIGVFFLIKAIL